MAGDPCEVMGFVVNREASRLQSLRDDDLFREACAIAEAEQQRSRMRDRFEAARGQIIRCHLPGMTIGGVVSDVGPEVIVLDSGESSLLIAQAALVGITGLPTALRRESEQNPRVHLTWSAALRQWAHAGAVRFTMADGDSFTAEIEAVGADYVDTRLLDGSTFTLLLTGIRIVIRNH